MINKKFFCSALIIVSILFFTVLSAHAEPADSAATIEFNPLFQSAYITGNKAKFEEDHWTSRNSSGGIGNMSISKQLNRQDSLEFEGRAIAGNNDYNADLILDREDVGSLKVTFNEFRKYYDNTGGFFSLDNFNQFYPARLDKDLHLDIGKFKIEGMLAKENSPEYKLSYERDSRNGSKSLLDWNYITSTINHKIYPSFLETDEVVNKFKFGVKKAALNSEVSAEQNYENTKGANKDIYAESMALSTGAITGIKTQYLNMDSNSYSTVLRGSRDINSKVNVSCGMLYNRYTGGSTEYLDPDTAMPNPAAIKQDGITVFPTISFRPSKDFLMDAGSKVEFIMKNANSTLNSPTTLISITSDTNQKILSQNLQLKYSGFKKSVLYAGADFDQQYISQFEESNCVTSASSNFSRKTDTLKTNRNVTVGWKWYPFSKANITAEYKNKDELTNNPNEFLTGAVVNGYRGYIDSMRFITDTPILKLNYKPYRWIGYNLGYAYESTSYGIRTRDYDQNIMARYRSNSYSTDVTVTPSDFLYLVLFYQKKYAATKTSAQNLSPQGPPRYDANVDVLSLTCSYAPTAKTTIRSGYSMYRTEDFNNFASATTDLPLGLNNMSQNASFGVERKLTANSSLEVKYTFSQYNENSNAGINDYTAHALYTVFNTKF